MYRMLRYSGVSVAILVLLAPSAHAQFLKGILAAEGASALPIAPINLVIKAVVLWLLGITGAIGVTMLAVAGVMYMTAVGDDTQMEKAKKTARYAVIGIIVALSGLIVITAITRLLSGKSNF